MSSGIAATAGTIRQPGFHHVKPRLSDERWRTRGVMLRNGGITTQVLKDLSPIPAAYVVRPSKPRSRRSPISIGRSWSRNMRHTRRPEDGLGLSIGYQIR